jgi:hypothetical protein
MKNGILLWERWVSSKDPKPFPMQATMLKIVYTESGVNYDRFKKMEIDILAFNREYKITCDISSTELYQKYISTVEEMIETFDIAEPRLEEISC